MRLALLILILSGCGQPIYVQPELQPYVDRFTAAYGRTLEKTIEVKFDDLKDQPILILGECDGMGGERPRVLIRQGIWETYNDASRELIIFHELGHCELERHHEGELSESIMRPTILLDSDYINYQNYYVNELFSRVARLPDSSLEVKK